MSHFKVILFACCIVILTWVKSTEGDLDVKCATEKCACCSSGKCNGEGTDTCDGCINEFTTRNCSQRCPPNCVNCPQIIISRYETCFECKKGFYKGYSKDNHDYPIQNDCTLECKTGCAECTSYYNCSECASGYFSPTTPKICQKCLENCNTCNSNDTCARCKDGFFWNGFRCDSCSKQGCKRCQSSLNCTECNNKFRLVGGNCINCPEGCLSCSADSTCSKCEQGFSLIAATCLRCDTGCESCTLIEQSTNVCETCKTGYYLSEYKCSKCPNGCAHCDTKDNCRLCLAEYKPVNGSCYKCPDKRCQVCSSDLYCSKCTENYYVINGTCHPCSETCARCTSTRNCTECKEGFYGVTCSYRCEHNCTTCEQTTGKCLHTKRTSQSEQENAIPGGTIAAVIALVFVVVIVCLVILIKRNWISFPPRFLKKPQFEKKSEKIQNDEESVQSRDSLLESDPENLNLLHSDEVVSLEDHAVYIYQRTTTLHRFDRSEAFFEKSGEIQDEEEAGESRDPKNSGQSKPDKTSQKYERGNTTPHKSEKRDTFAPQHYSESNINAESSKITEKRKAEKSLKPQTGFKPVRVEKRGEKVDCKDKMEKEFQKKKAITSPKPQSEFEPARKEAGDYKEKMEKEFQEVKKAASKERKEDKQKGHKNSEYTILTDTSEISPESDSMEKLQSRIWKTVWNEKITRVVILLEFQTDIDEHDWSNCAAELIVSLKVIKRENKTVTADYAINWKHSERKGTIVFVHTPRSGYDGELIGLQNLINRSQEPTNFKTLIYCSSDDAVQFAAMFGVYDQVVRNRDKTKYENVPLYTKNILAEYPDAIRDSEHYSYIYAALRKDFTLSRQPYK